MKKQTPHLLKFRRLLKLLGPDIPVSDEGRLAGMLELLWLEVAQNCPRGDIGQLRDDEIAFLARWDGEPSALIEALVEERWLDRCAVHRLIVHDWHDHAPAWVHKVVISKWGRDTSGNPNFAVKTPVATGVQHSVNHSVFPEVDSSGHSIPCLPNLTQPNLTQPNPTTCTEPASPASVQKQPEDQSPPVMTFPVVPKAKGGISEWPLTEAKLVEYQQSFPDLDVLAQARAARQWCVDNREKRKTLTGMGRFLTNWLTKEQNRGSGGKRPATSNGKSRVPTDEELANWNPQDGGLE